MAISRDDVEKIAHLARLNITEENITAATERLANVLAMVDQLQAIDTTGIEPLAHPLDTVQRLRADVVTEGNQREQLLKNAPLVQNQWIANPRVLVSVPCKATEVEKRAIRESVLSAGARDVRIIEEPMVAAIGAGLDVEKARGSMVVDIGGGTTEIGIISLNGLVYADSVRIGGDRFDESIIAYVRRNYGSVIGDATAERIKHEVGCAFGGGELREIDVRGRNLAEGVPRSFTLNSDEILESLQEPLGGIIQAIKSALEQSPPELASDIAESGIVLTGGGALLRDIDKLVTHETGLPVVIAEDPLTCVARGGGRALELMDNKEFDLLSY